MNDKIIAVTFHKCGTCVFAQTFKNSMADCYGNPPSVMVLGTSNDALGRPQMHIEALVPKVKDDRPACHLHVRRTDFATSGRS